MNQAKPHDDFKLDLPTDEEMETLHREMLAKMKAEGLTEEQIKNEIEILKMHGFW